MHHIRSLRAGLAALCLFVLVAATPTRAAEIDLSPLVEWGLSAGNAILSALVIAAVGYVGAILQRFLKEKLKIDLALADAASNRMLHDNIQRGINALEGVARDALFKNGRRVTVDVDNPAVAAVAARMVRLSPDLLGRLGLDEEGVKVLVAEKLRVPASPAPSGAAVPAGALAA